jgi:hypothetical protein
MSNMVRTTITIPRALKKAMREFEAKGNQVNWSNLASLAFEAHINANTHVSTDLLSRLEVIRGTCKEIQHSTNVNLKADIATLAYQLAYVANILSKHLETGER